MHCNSKCVTGQHGYRWPYRKRGIPSSFQPSWRGPFVVTELIGNTNCKIKDEFGKIQSVHLNQLKLIEKRKDYSNHIIRPETCKEKSYISFDDFIYDDGDHFVGNDRENGPEEPIINHGWCNIDHENILPSRTRNFGKRGYDDPP